MNVQETAPKTRRIVSFRVDAGTDIGIGHLRRCASLADELMNAGFECVFLCSTITQADLERLRKKGHRILIIHSEVTTTQTSEAEILDAENTIVHLSAVKPNLVIVDHYNLGFVWETRLKNEGYLILVIDDLCDRNHNCDVYVNNSPTAELDLRNSPDTVPKHSTLFLGTDYCFISNEYKFLRNKVLPRNGEVSRILVCFGGSDLRNITSTAVNAVTSKAFKNIQFDIVSGPANIHATEIREKTIKFPNMNYHHSPNSLSQLMAACDLMIGAGGTTTWERLCLGLPSIVISIAENQTKICTELHKRGLITYLGRDSEVTEKQIADETLRKMTQVGALSNLSKKLSAAIDGYGCNRLVNSIQSLCKIEK